MLAATVTEHRLYRTPPDYSQDGAPESDMFDHARAEFYKTPFPTDAFDAWRMYRADLCERTGISWVELNQWPEYLEDWQPQTVIQCHPDTEKDCATVRVLKSVEAVKLQHSVFVDCARLFYKHTSPTQSIFLSEIGNFMFNNNTSPQCLMIRIDCHVQAGHKIFPHIKTLLTRYIQSGKKLVFVFEDQQLSSDPFDVKHMANKWLEF